jgi:hypothetical protein
MRKYRCYVRTVLLSVLAAFVIDAIINFDEYKHGWAMSFSEEKQNELIHHDTATLPVAIGQATGAVFGFLLLRD